MVYDSVWFSGLTPDNLDMCCPIIFKISACQCDLSQCCQYGVAEDGYCRPVWSTICITAISFQPEARGPTVVEPATSASHMTNNNFEDEKSTKQSRKSQYNFPRDSRQTTSMKQALILSNFIFIDIIIHTFYHYRQLGCLGAGSMYRAHILLSINLQTYWHIVVLWYQQDKCWLRS